MRVNIRYINSTRCSSSVEDVPLLEFMYSYLQVCQVRSEDVNDDDDVELNVLGCRVDILGTNCDQCVCMVQCCFTSTETMKLIRTGGPGRPPRLSHSS